MAPWNMTLFLTLVQETLAGGSTSLRKVPADKFGSGRKHEHTSARRALDINLIGAKSFYMPNITDRAEAAKATAVLAGGFLVRGARFPSAPRRDQGRFRLFGRQPTQSNL
jgi:hypothetical protein